MAGQVFVSHSSRDGVWVEWVAAQARALGVHPYLAEHDSQAGGRLSDKVERAIAASDVVIVLLTRNSIDSRYVHQEIGYAKALHKLIVPLVHPEIAHESRAMLDGIEHIVFDFASPPGGAADLVGKLRDVAAKAQLRQTFQGVLVASVVLTLVVLAFQASDAPDLGLGTFG